MNLAELQAALGVLFQHLQGNQQHGEVGRRAGKWLDEPGPAEKVMASSWRIQKVPVKEAAVAGQPTGEVAEEEVVARVDAALNDPSILVGQTCSFLPAHPAKDQPSCPT